MLSTLSITHVLVEFGKKTGVPCSHTISSLLFMKMTIHDYCEQFFLVQRYKEYYSHSIYHIEDRSVWFDAFGAQDGNVAFKASQEFKTFHNFSHNFEDTPVDLAFIIKIFH